MFTLEDVHTEEYKGMTITIHQDDDAMSPDEWADDNAFLVHYHRDFYLSRDSVITEDDARAWYQGEEIEQVTEYWIFPVAAYIHGGVALALGNGRGFPDYCWDVCHCGLVLLAREEWADEAAARKYAEAKIQEWNYYLSGQVYGYVVEDQDGEHIDSCWGFIGEYDDDEYSALTEARSAVDYHTKSS